MHIEIQISIRKIAHVLICHLKEQSRAISLTQSTHLYSNIIAKLCDQFPFWSFVDTMVLNQSLPPCLFSYCYIFVDYYNNNIQVLSH